MNKTIKNSEVYDNADFVLWKTKWMKRLTKFNNPHDKSMELMNSSNPMVIPRNHKVEEALISASNGDLTLFNRLIKILKNPYTVNSNDFEFMSPAPHSDKKYQTFCGTKLVIIRKVLV